MQTRIKATRNNKNGGAKANKPGSRLLNIPELSIERMIKLEKKRKAEEENIAKEKKTVNLKKIKLKDPDPETDEPNETKKTAGKQSEIKKKTGKPKKEKDSDKHPQKKSISKPKKISGKVEELEEESREHDKNKVKSGKLNIGEDNRSFKRKTVDTPIKPELIKKKKTNKSEDSLSDREISSMLSSKEHDVSESKADETKSVKKLKSKDSKPFKSDSPKALIKGKNDKITPKAHKSLSDKKETTPGIKSSSSKNQKKSITVSEIKSVRKDSVSKSASKQSNSESNSARNTALKKSLNTSSSSGKSSPKIVLEKSENLSKVVAVSGNKPIGDINETIKEMQEKIKKLEKKSILDEKKIEMFKKALLKQRKADIRTLMDETESELLLRMELLYLHYNPQRICRLCLMLIDKAECQPSLNCNQQLISLVQEATSIQVDLVEGMPSGICSNCLEQIEQLDWIKRRIKTSNSLVAKFMATRKHLLFGGSFQDVLVDRPRPVESPVLGPLPVPGLEKGRDQSSDLSAEMKIEDVFSLNGYDGEDASSTSSSELELRNTMIKNNALKRKKQLADIRARKAVFDRKMRSLRCDRCRTQFLNRWSLTSHQDYCRRRIACMECGKRFWHVHLYLRHKKRRSAVCMRARPGRSCRPCRATYRWKWQLVMHILKHEPQVCQVCDKVLYSEERLKKHVFRTHMDFAF